MAVTVMKTIRDDIPGFLSEVKPTQTDTVYMVYDGGDDYLHDGYIFGTLKAAKDYVMDFAGPGLANHYRYWNEMQYYDQNMDTKETELLNYIVDYKIIF